MRTTTLTLVAVLLAALALAGCDRGGRTITTIEKSPPGNLPRELVGTWENGVGANVQFRGSGTVSGLDGCNQFSGSWSRGTADDEIRVDVEPRTERRCVAPATLSLAETMTWKLDGGELTLSSADGPDNTLTKRATGGMG